MHKCIRLGGGGGYYLGTIFFFMSSGYFLKINYFTWANLLAGLQMLGTIEFYTVTFHMYKLIFIFAVYQLSIGFNIAGSNWIKC